MSKFSFGLSTDKLVKKDSIPSLNRATITDGKLLAYYIEHPLSGRDDYILQSLNTTYDCMAPIYSYINEHSAHDLCNSAVSGFSSINVANTVSNTVLQGSMSANKTLGFYTVYPLTSYYSKPSKLTIQYVNGYYISYYQMAMLNHGYIDNNYSVAFSYNANATLSSWAFCNATAKNKSIAWYDSDSDNSAIALYYSTAHNYAIAMYNSYANSKLGQADKSDLRKSVSIAMYNSDANSYGVALYDSAVVGGVALYNSNAITTNYSHARSIVMHNSNAYTTQGPSVYHCISMYNSTRTY